MDATWRLVSGREWKGGHLSKERWSISWSGSRCGREEEIESGLCARCVAVAAVGDFVVKRRISDPPYRAYVVPRPSSCRCGAPGPFFFSPDPGDHGRTVRVDGNPVVSYVLATMEYAAGMYDRDNPPPERLCRCAEIRAAAAALAPRDFILDTKWRAIRRWSCAADFERTCEFGRAPTDEALSVLAELFSIEPECPGWTGVSWRRDRADGRVVVFSTTHDSSG